MPSVGDRRLGIPRAGRRLRRALAAALAASLAPLPAPATDFRVEELEGIFDVSLTYGLLARVEGRDSDLIGIGNGGNAPTVNVDDGNLNYDRGIVANGLRATGELTLRWRQFGAFVRGYGFYDFETELGDRDHTGLSGDAEDLVGSGGEIQDYYLTSRFKLRGIPVQLRLGNQVLNWGESGFLRFGVDVINPVDFVAVFQPTATRRDTLIRQGMLWAAANVTETIAIEGFYQYDWEEMRLAPVGWFFSPDDRIGGDGVHFAMEGFGEFSDLGTDLDAYFDLPAGTLGFDPDFMRIPSAGRKKPSDQGQFGFAVQAIVPVLNSTKLALHFVNYHSRLPLISGRTAGQEAIDATSDEAVDARAQDLADETGLPFDQARAIEETLTIGRFANETRYFASYPEDVRMLGFSFNTALPRTGTLVAGEVSHHFDWPVQIPKEEVLVASLSPIQFTEIFGKTSLGEFGADETVQGFVKADKTQISLGIIQLFGPRLGAAQTQLGFDIGWVHIHDLPKSDLADDDSWGYRIVAALTYNGVFGGFSLRPRVVWTHDVDGTTPGPVPAFIEDRKSFSVGLAVNYIDTWTLDLGYTTIFGGAPLNLIADRDFFRLNLTFHL
jgi:hypothetical protein